MKVLLDVTQTLDKNASYYYEKAKKAKRKMDGAKAAYQAALQRLARLDANEQKAKAKPVVQERKKQWYEKFRWFHTSEGFLCLGGRDATTNDILVKKHTDKEDWVFHTEMAGAPFFVLKAEGKTPGEASLQEAATAAASYSKAWGLGLATAEVYAIRPHQLSKSAPAGQYLGKGAFTVEGKRTYFTPTLQVALGKKEDSLIGGPPQAIQAQTRDLFMILPGEKKSSDLAKTLHKRWGFPLEDIQRFLPPGPGRLVLPPRERPA